MTKRSADVKKDVGGAKGGGSRAPPRRQNKGARIPDLYWYAGLCLIVIFSLYLRVFIPWNNVFIANGVRFASESDAWYHMMLAQSTVMHLHRTFFDPLTYFPFGTSLHFGPFVSWGITVLSYIVGLGSPSMHTVEVVGAFWPALLGTVLIFPVYFLGRELGGRGCGLLAALMVTIFPGQLFSRTVLGFTDHHSSEILLSTLTMLFFLLAMRTGRNLTFDSLLKRGLLSAKSPLIYALLAGVFMGLYLDAWAMGILFEGIILIFFVVQGTVDYLRGRGTDYLGIILGLGFAVALLLLLPFANPANHFSLIQYSLFQPLMLFLGMAFALVTSYLASVLRKKRMDWYVFPASAVGVGVLGLLLAAVAVPFFVANLFAGLGTYLLPRTGGAATVAELGALTNNNGIQNNFPGLFGFDLFSPFVISLIGLALMALNYYRKSQPGDLLVITWSAVMFFLTLSQNRSAYYYGVNAALLCAYLSIRIMDYVRLADLEGAIMQKARDPAKILEDLKVQHILAVFLVIFVFVIPSLTAPTGSMEMARWTVGPNPEWYNSILWLKDNTPEPGLDIYDIYQRPPEGQFFQYPSTAYGVMSWWDYGHLIETIGHRYPNANPFQEGIGNKSSGVPGSSPFFLAESEEEAEQVLTDLNTSLSPYSNSRYIMTDVEMAIGKFHAMASWSAIPNSKYTGAVYQPQGEVLVPIQLWQEPYYRTMIARLHFFDGSETPIGEAIGVAYDSLEIQDGIRAPVMVLPPKISRNY
ncbi:MAG: oligosaccharyl transferase, archaeosortase A system-associated, partial [Methanosarcinales archaeon]|nr:oligosaccharyl transferase, archaeosortase A system-associated [Methanosarcinales archaeon]